MASIRQLKSGRWQARVTRKGLAPEVKSFDAHDDATKWGRAIEAEIDRGFFVSLKAAERTTLADVLLRYAAEVSPTKRSAKDNIAKLKFLARQRIAKLSLANLTPQAVAQFRDERLMVVSAGTVILDLATLRSTLNHARREWGFAIDNPVERVRLPASPMHRERTLSQEEEARLLDALTVGSLRREDGKFSKDTRCPWIKPMAIVAIESAMRRGELLALRWEHVDLQRRTAFLPLTKNGRSRRVPLSLRAVETLKAMPRSIDGRVFPLSHWTVEQVFEGARNRAGLDNLKFHDLRHTACSRLALKVPNVIELAAITGHSNVQMLKRYYHVGIDYLVEKIA
jgi:integrase